MLLLKTTLCLAIVNGVLGQYCDITSANKCWSPMTATMGDLIPSSTPSGVPPAVKVRGVCNGLHKVFACTENKMADCSPGDRLLYDTARSSATFLCHQGKQGYIDYAQCLFSEASHSRMKTCTSDALPLIKSFLFTMSDLSQLKMMAKPLCGLASTVRDCLFDTARENCGHSAALYLQQYMDATLQPFSRFLSCPPPKPEMEYLQLPEKVTINAKIVPPYESNLSPEVLTSTPPNKRMTPSAPLGGVLSEDSVNGVQAPQCDRYCFVYQHNLPLSVKQGYDDWCEINCRQGFCPPTSCTCDCSPVRRRIVCEAAGLRFQQGSGGSKWCTSVCQQGFCPKHYCKCRVELEPATGLH